MYLPRTVEKEIPQLCKNFKVLLVTGMRQVGKSTLLQHLSEADRNYVSLDNFDDLDLAEQSPGAFFLQHQPPGFKQPELLLILQGRNMEYMLKISVKRRYRHI